MKRLKDITKAAASAALAVVLAVGLTPTLALAANSSDSNSSSSSSAQTQDQNASGDANNQNNNGNSDSTPPEPPSGDAGQGEGGEPPEMPDGEAPSGQAPDGQGGQAPDGQGGGGQAPDAQGGGANTQSFDYSGEYSAALSANGEEVTSDGETIEATEVDQNAGLAQNAGTLTITNGTLTKSGDDTNGDNCNFYGLNSILLSVNDGSKAIISDSSLSATSEGSNGIFATDSGLAWANNDTITTTAGNSRGLDATYGGTIVANEMTISTQGDHSAGIATDRGGGYISAANSTIETSGSGSPVLYSTGDIEVSNLTGTATGSQIAGMEGLNSIQIWNSDLTSTITDKTASDPVANGVIIYQSTSGDAETATGETAIFEASDSTLTSSIESGAMFYLTNTTANIVLDNTELNFDSSKAALIEAAGNDSNNWGTAGSNGATVKFTGIGETLSGNVNVDTISSIDLYLTESTTWTGATSITENATNTNPTDSPLTVNVDETSTWVVTEDCTVTNLNVMDGGSVVDESGKTVTIVAAGETVVEGDSDLTVTVTGAYSTSFELTDDNAIAKASIDRSEFDSYFGVDTAFGADGVEKTVADTTTTTTTDDGASITENVDTQDEGFFGWIWGVITGWFSSIFG